MTVDNIPETEGSPKSGIFDKRPSPDVIPNNMKENQAPVKEDFKDPFKLQQEEISARSSKPRSLPDPSELAAQNVNKAMSGNNGGLNIEQELEDMDKISEADLELAQKMVFDGYVDFDVEIKNLKDCKATICSTNAEEMSIIDEVLFDMVEAAEHRDDDTVKLPQNHINSMRNALFLALSYKGMNKKELSPVSSYYLNTIKRAIIKVSELEDSGDLKGSAELKTALKTSLKKRATLIKRLPTSFIDFLSNEKFEFDNKMLKIMSSKGVLPKS